MQLLLLWWSNNGGSGKNYTQAITRAHTHADMLCMPLQMTSRASKGHEIVLP